MKYKKCTDCKKVLNKRQTFYLYKSASYLYDKLQNTREISNHILFYIQLFTILKPFVLLYDQMS